jgi:CheY-like chemotaxis protein
MSRVLVVEDSPTQAQATALILHEAGFAVDIAPNAEQALARLSADRFDLVLSDLMLPGASGFDLCRRIKADPQLGSIPVVVLTSQADPVNVLRGLEAGADGFMTKDREPAEVVARIHRVLGQHTGSTSAAPPICVEFLNQQFELAAGREQLLNVLLAAFGDVVHLNEQYRSEITQRRKIEAELHKARAGAEAANRAKSAFLASMSHEIRTPMNGILGMTDLALHTELTAEQREYLNMVKASADSLLMIINDILDFSKIEAGKLELDAAPFSLRDSLGDTLRSLALRAYQKGLELAYRVDVDVPDGLIGDPLRLRQIIVNLVGNSIKFTDKGEVIVEVKQSTTDHTDNTDNKKPDREARQPAADPRAGGLSAPDSASSLSVSSVVELIFTVRDTGIGIPPEKQGTIFEAFSQADSSTTRKYGGTGLGLTISARLVGLMGGRIWVESKVGSGSTFHFTARFCRAAAPVHPVPELPVPLRDQPVLIVDDNATNRRILQELLTQWHMKPTAVDGGAPALAALKQATSARQPFVLVVLDAMMPGMDGFMLAEQIRQHPDLNRTALLMLTSGGQPGDADRCRALGIAVYLMKPIKQFDLLEGILKALRVSRFVRPRPESSPSPTRAATSRPLRILLVEDNPVNQRLAVRLLENEGHTVIVACDGKEALALLGVRGQESGVRSQGSGVSGRDAGLTPDSCPLTPDFDLVLMDVEMPEMDGFEATAAIRAGESSNGRHVPILAMTAHAMKGDRERCLQAGMDGYLSKPIQIAELRQALSNALA